MKTNAEEIQIEQCERLGELRNSLGMTSEDFAQELGFKDKIYIYNVIGRKQGIPKALLENLAMVRFEKGKVNLHWLLTGDGAMFLDEPQDMPSLDIAFRFMGNQFDNLVITQHRQKEESAALREEIIALQTQVITLQKRIERLEKR